MTNLLLHLLLATARPSILRFTPNSVLAPFTLGVFGVDAGEPRLQAGPKPVRFGGIGNRRPYSLLFSLRSLGMIATCWKAVVSSSAQSGRCVNEVSEVNG